MQLGEMEELLDIRLGMGAEMAPIRRERYEELLKKYAEFKKGRPNREYQ